MKNILSISILLLVFNPSSIAQKDSPYIYTKKKEVIYVNKIIDKSSYKFLTYEDSEGNQKQFSNRKILYVYDKEFRNYNIKLHLGMNNWGWVIHNDKYLLGVTRQANATSGCYKVYDINTVFDSGVVLDKIGETSAFKKKHNRKLLEFFQNYFSTCPTFIQHVKRTMQDTKTMDLIRDWCPCDCGMEDLLITRMKMLHEEVTSKK